MAQTYSLVSLIAFVAAAVLLALSLVLFFVFRIPSLINDLTGRAARKGIEQMRRENEKGGSKLHRTSGVNKARGRVTEPIRKGGNLYLPRTGGMANAPSLGKRPGGELTLEGTEPLPGNEATTLLEQEEATTLLEEGDGTTLLDTGEATTLLQSTPGTTEELDEGTVLLAEQAPLPVAPPAFTPLESIVLVHTQEVIS